MSKTRTLLLSALRRIVDGGDFEDGELNAILPDYNPLSFDEKVAWEELSHWADDADIREKDAKYAAYKREKICDCLRLVTSADEFRL